MNLLNWDPLALRDYNRLKRRLSPLKREQLEDRIDCLKEFPPSKWYELRNQQDGTITFRMETDQFAMVLGRFENGTVFITHIELRSK
jgi:hypothetical protein